MTHRTTKLFPFEKLLPYDAAYHILEAYISYWHRYKRITKRAKLRFENHDWHGIQEDGRERMTLYRDMVGETREGLLAVLGDRAADREVWREMKLHFHNETANFNTRNIAESFYNSVFRHSHPGTGADDELMFVYSTGNYRDFKSAVPIFHTIHLMEPIDLSMRQLLGSYSFSVPWQNLNRDIAYLCGALREWLIQHAIPGVPIRLEALKSLFFRNKIAFIVGRIVQQERQYPFVVPLMNGQDGIFTDTLLTERNHISPIFSYNRSYFLADVDVVTETVDFLQSILPMKGMGELYNSIGFEKHGKTVFFRDLVRHMERSLDQFDLAPGIKGMVMVVFTMPSHDVVFKIIRDKFAPPKHVSEAEVIQKYELVNQHDRVGRLADTYLFQHLILDKERFKPALLEELLNECGSKVKIVGNQVELTHVYVEKKMIPLNLFLEQASSEAAVNAINEYGLAIRHLASVNIFPGDMLLKNFGVTRLRRVVFYDYDEIGFLTDYNFRRLPPARDEDDEVAGEPWFYVGEHDIFPEEFPKFLVGAPHLRRTLEELHGDLFDIAFWQDMQARLRAGEIVEILPYPDQIRFG